MKVFVIIILISQISANKIIESIESESAKISQVVADLTQSFIENSNDNFELIQYGNASGEICNEIAKKFPHIILKKLPNEPRAIPVNKPTVVVCRNFSDILNLTWNMYLVNLLPKTSIVIIYCEENGKFEGFKSFLTIRIMNLHIHPIVYVLNNFGDAIELNTLKICIPAIGCDPGNWETINKYNKSTNSWLNPPKIPKKHQNLNGTEIVFGIFPNAPINRFKLINNNTEVVVTGIASDIARIVAEKYNFTIYFQPFAPPKQATGRQSYSFSPVRINGTVKLPKLFLDVVRVLDSHHSFPSGEIGYATTQPFMNLNKYFAVTPGDLYTSYEKLMWPFDFTTWMFIISTFMAAYVVIFIVNQFDRNIQAILYGTGISTASLNVLSIFFGISMAKLPTKNFARFVLMVFILYCLIIRTAYQGVLFDILSGSHQRPPIDDYDEVLLQNYTLYKRNHDNVGEGYVRQKLVNETSIVVYAHLIGTDKEIHQIFASQCQNSSARMFMSLKTEHLYMYNEATQQVCPWHIIKYPRENYAAFGSYPANHFFFQMLNEVIDTFTPTGLIEHVVRRNFEERYYIKRRIGDPDSMTLNDLGFGFILWIFSLIPTILVFFAELLGCVRRRRESKKFTKIKFEKVHSEISIKVKRGGDSKCKNNPKFPAAPALLKLHLRS